MEQEENTGFVLEETLGFAVQRASIIMKKQLIELFQEQGYHITPEEFAILGRLWEEDGLLQSVINDKTLKDKTTVTRLLNRLIKKGLIKKKTDAADRRNYRIHLTKKGKTLKDQIIPIVEQLLAAASRNITAADLQTTIQTLKAIFANLN